MNRIFFLLSLTTLLTFSACESAAVSLATTTKDIWVTADGVGNGAFGSLAAADTFCTNDSNNPDNTKTYKAMIAFPGQRIACTTANCTDSAENTSWVLTADSNYYRPDGTYVGTTNSAGIFTSLDDSIDDSHVSIYTGLAGDWTVGNTCNTWTNNAGTAHGGWADETTPTGLLADSNNLNCGQDLQIICVEQ